MGYEEHQQRHSKIMEKKQKTLAGALLNNKIENLKQVQVDSTNWSVFYIDILTNEKWVKEYPHSEMHGGGEPILQLIEKFPWE